jgi:hypothetical protein
VLKHHSVAVRGQRRSRHITSSEYEPELRRVAITMARSSGKAFFTNFGTYDAPFPTRIRLALANSWKGTHPIRLLWELRSARLLTASPGAP